LPDKDCNKTWIAIKKPVCNIGSQGFKVFPGHQSLFEGIDDSLVRKCFIFLYQSRRSDYISM